LKQNKWPAMKMCSYEQDEAVVAAVYVAVAVAAGGGSTAACGLKKGKNESTRDMKWYQVAQETGRASFWLIGSV